MNYGLNDIYSKNLKLLYVEDDRILREELSEFIEMKFPNLITAADGRDGLIKAEKYQPDIVITDIKMPKMNGIEMAMQLKKRRKSLPVIVTTAFSDVDYLVKAIEIGINRFIQKPVDGKQLLEAISTCALPEYQQWQIGEIEEDLNASFEIMLGKSPAIKQVSKMIRQVAHTSFSVVLEGETGVGKSHVARLIHQMSKRKERRFLYLDIGSVPDTLIESELFGHVKGAFTGAHHSKKGYFEAADGGTLFLDEIENMTPYVQSKFLAAVEEGRITPVGSTESISVDVRLVTASNKNIEQQVSEGLFREDLYYRLNEFHIPIPPLRERKEDIELFVDRFIKDAAEELDKKIESLTDSAMVKLIDYNWPGNIREVKNIVRKAVLLAESSIIECEHLIFSHGFQKTMQQSYTEGICSYRLADVERDAIKRALKKTDGKKLEAAELLEINYRTLIRKIEKYNLT